MSMYVFYNQEKKSVWVSVCLWLHHFKSPSQLHLLEERLFSSTKSVFWGFDLLGGILPWPDVLAAGWQDEAELGRVCDRCIWQEQQ